MSFREMLCRLMEENNTSNLSLSKAIGVSDMAVARWKKGETVPSLDNAISVAAYYDISLDELAGIKLNVDNSRFFKLPVLGEVTAHTIHIYGLPKGEFVFATQNDIDNYPVSECYVLKIIDKAMNPEFQKGTYLFVHQQNQCTDGDYVIYQQMDSITESGHTVNMYSLRKFTRVDSKIELVSPNPNENNISYRKQDINLINIQGIVIGKFDIYKNQLVGKITY